MEGLGAGIASAAAQAALACALCAACASPAMAAETATAGGGAAASVASISQGTMRNVTFVCATSDGSLVFSGEAFSIWRVADETGAPTGAFSGIEDTGDEAAWAYALSAAAQNVDPDLTFHSGSAGTGAVALAPGKFLVAGESATVGGVTYQAVPYVMDLTDRALALDLTSYVKYTTTAPSPAAPIADGGGETASEGTGDGGAKSGLAVTGDAVAIGAVCAAAGAAAGAARMAAGKDRKKTKSDNEEGER